MEKKNFKETELSKSPKRKAVKDEPRAIVSESDVEAENTNFLDDLLQSADEIAAAVAGVSSIDVKADVEEKTDDDNEDIDPSFFDEILVTADDERRKTKLTRKPFRVKRESFELEDGEVDDNDKGSDLVDQQGQNDSEETKHRKRKESSNIVSSTSRISENSKARLQVRAEFRSLNEFSTAPPEEPVSSVEIPQTKIETFIGASTLFQPLPFQLNATHEESTEKKPEKELTAEEKTTKAIECVLFAQRALQKAKEQKEKQFYANDPVFPYTPTVRKLPTSFSHFTQQIYDHRSPLHSVNNVTFQFNSMATRLNLQQWGLESLPPKSKSIARTLGYDIDTLNAKKQIIKIPDKIQKLNESNAKSGDKELCETSNSTLYMNAMVQTDEVKVIPSRRRDFYRDVCLQHSPPTSVTGTQTNPAYTGEGDDLPLFKNIREMNENQIEAVDCFIQLILEPTSNSGIDFYQKRKRLEKIYEISQIPSDIVPSLKRTADEAGFRMVSPPPPPRLYVTDDLIKKESDSYYHSSENRSTRALYQRRNRFSAAENNKPSTSIRFYGRGGMRR